MSVNTERQWALAGRKAKARAEAVRGAVRKVVKADTTRGLEGIPFASQKAKDLALASGLGWGAFDDLEASSVRGYTVADVRGITD
jgi:hypothetical protein